MLSKVSAVVASIGLFGSVLASPSHFDTPHEFGVPRQVLFAQETCFDDNARGTDDICYPVNSTSWESGYLSGSTFTMKYYNDPSCDVEVGSMDFPLTTRGCSSAGPVYYVEEYFAYSVMIPYDDVDCTVPSSDEGIIYWPEGRCNYQIDDDGVSVVQQRFTVWNENNGTVEMWSTPVGSFDENMACFGDPHSKMSLTPGYNVTSGVDGFFPCYTWVRYPEFDPASECFDMGSLVASHRRGANRWVGDGSIEKCETPLRYGRMRFTSIIMAPSPGMLKVRLDIEQRNKIWNEDASIFITFGPSNATDSNSSYEWMQKLYEESDIVRYYSSVPDDDRVPAQNHRLEVTLHYDELIGDDGSKLDFSSGNYSFRARISVDKRDGTGLFLSDCVVADNVEIGEEFSPI